ncbi:hypothetical protein BT96DRAFT_965029 [Gymnopus androsaceus JB14]|uniref:HAD-like protein n=1 Tax=Gymnopus androsaceus JB14 TaxID=1447944 RepID=A0A6A4HSZ0_9AGAR|nr:hypothetical protein BT96DRAFT_965029 [Gymnopus androsaceus JB14]
MSPQNLILDIGGVVLDYSIDKPIALPPRQIKTALQSTIWNDYESGRYTRQECYNKLTTTFDISLEDWEQTVRQLNDSLVENVDFIQAIRSIRSTYPNLGVFAMSNVSGPDFEDIRSFVKGWGIFDAVFTSAEAMCRKPEVAFYQRSCIFVDDKPENVVAAHTLGMRGVVFTSTVAVVNKLHNLLGDPAERGMNFLRQNSGNLFCETDKGYKLYDNFSQLLILSCIGDRTLVRLDNNGPTWQYFIGTPIFTDLKYPDDADTTSLAMVTLDAPPEERQVVMDTILSHLTVDGLPLAYFDHTRPRFCPFVCANVLRLFYLNDQGYKMASTLEFLCRVLRTRAYEFDTRYYYSSDWLFYYLGDLCGRCSNPELSELRHLLETRLRERMGCDKEVLSASMRLLAAQSLGLENKRDLETLLDSQQADGGWELAWLFRYGSVDVKIGSRSVVTAMAIKGIIDSQ